MAQEIKEYEVVRGALTKMEDIEKALPSHISKDKFIQVVVTAVQNKPDLLKLNRQSLYLSCIKCAQDGLLPDGQEAALVPMKNNVAYIPMIAGVLKKVRQSGQISTCDSQEVCKNDTYESWTDEKGPHFRHVKARGVRGEPILTYAYAIAKDGGVYFEEMDEEQMKAIEKCSKTDDVWAGDFRSEMKRKSVMHRLSKRLPMNTDIERVIERDNEIYDLSGEEAKKEPGKTTSSKLNQAVEDADFKPTTSATAKPVVAEPVKAAAPVLDENSKLVQGLIENLTKKDILKEGKPSTKYGCKILTAWYGTEDKELYSKMEKFCNEKVLVNLAYNECTRKNDRGADQLYLDAIDLKVVVADDNGDVSPI